MAENSGKTDVTDREPNPMLGQLHNAEDTCLKNHSGGGDQVSGPGPNGKELSEKTSFSGHHDHQSTTVPAIPSLNTLPQDKVSVNDKAVDGGEAGVIEPTEKGANGSKKSTSLDEDDESYPEGGLHAWLVVLGAFCALFIVFGLANSTSAFQEIFSSDLLKEYSPDAIGWIFSVNLFFTFLSSIYVGVWFDAYGPRIPVLLGCIGMVVGMMLLGECTQYWHFLLDYGVLNGLSGALLMTPAFACIAHFFNRRRGLATGLASIAGSLGGIVVPLMLRGLLPKVGFAWASRIIGFVFLALSVPANLLLKKRLPPTVFKVSLIPDLTPMLDMPFFVCTAGVFLMEWGLFVPLAYISSYAVDHGQTMSSAFLMITLTNVGSLFGRWVPGILADKLGRFNVILASIALCCISIFALWLPAGDSLPVMIVFVIFFGFVSGSNLGLIPVCLSQLCDTDEYGRYFAASYFVVSFGTLTSVPIGGALLTACGGHYWGLIVFSGLAYFGAFICYLTTRVMRVGRGLRVKF